VNAAAAQFIGMEKNSKDVVQIRKHWEKLEDCWPTNGSAMGGNLDSGLPQRGTLAFVLSGGKKDSGGGPMSAKHTSSAFQKSFTDSTSSVVCTL